MEELAIAVCIQRGAVVPARPHREVIDPMMVTVRGIVALPTVVGRVARIVLVTKDTR